MDIFLIKIIFLSPQPSVNYPNKQHEGDRILYTAGYEGWYV